MATATKYTIRAKDGAPTIEWSAEAYSVGGRNRFDLFRNGELFAEGIAPDAIEATVALAGGRDAKARHRIARKFREEA